MPWANIWKTEPLRPSTVPGGQAQGHDAHMRDGRVTDDVFQIGLRQTDKDAVDNAADGQEAEKGRPVLEALRAEIHGHPQDAIGTKFH